jgi:molybdenum cofactor synthesis domain-containing protein
MLIGLKLASRRIGLERPTKLAIAHTARYFKMEDQSAIRTSACLIIGDEVLNGKIKDSNSSYFAKFCFGLGIEVRHVAVVPDDEKDIVETIQLLSSRYDFVVTSGGIGSTHDDITYECLAKAFELPMGTHQMTTERMRRISKTLLQTDDEEVRNAQLRMATFPIGPNVDQLFVLEDSWVPIVAINRKVYILPGVPQLFERLLEGLRPMIEPRVPKHSTMIRYFVNTKLKEAVIAPYLRRLQESVSDKGVKIGSYPHYGLDSVSVSIIGPKRAQHELRQIVSQVEQNIDGKEVSAEEEATKR